MLGRLEMDVSDCVDTYKDLLEDVFGHRKHKYEVGLKGNLQARFDESLLRTAIEKTVGKKTDVNTMFDDGKLRSSRT